MAVDYISYETMKAARDTADFTFWIMIGTWVAGIATSFAVILTLYVTVNQKRVRLSCVVGEKIIVSPLHSFGDAESRGISFVITNKSNFPVQINHLGLRCKSYPWQEKKYWFLKIDKHPYGDSIPKKIEQGEQCHLWIPLDEREDDWYKYLSGIIYKAGRKPERMRIVVTTSFGKSPSFKLPKKILESLNTAQAS